MDDACPGSLEISGHCLAAARVIASLLVGPVKKEHKTKGWCKKKNRNKEEREDKTVKINNLHSWQQIFLTFLGREWQYHSEKPCHHQMASPHNLRYLMLHWSSCDQVYIQFVYSAQEKGGQRGCSISRIDLSSVRSTEIPTSLSKLPLHLHIHNINLK